MSHQLRSAAQHTGATGPGRRHRNENETKTVRAMVLESESMSDTMLAAKGKVEKLVKRESQKRER